jgi:hypothetical protein
VLGGVTAVFEMPNTKPLTTDSERLADKVNRARHRMFCDFAFFVGGTRDNVADIPNLEKLEASAGIKVFMGSSTGDLLVDEEAALDRIIARISRRASFHAEDEARLKARMHLRIDDARQNMQTLRVDPVRGFGRAEVAYSRDFPARDCKIADALAVMVDDCRTLDHDIECFGHSSRRSLDLPSARTPHT